MSDTDREFVRIDEAVARAFGHTSASSVSTVDQFKRAGFCQQDAERGARLLESREYFGFEDVATSLMFPMGDDARVKARQRNPRVTPERIREAAAAVAEQVPHGVVEKLVEATLSGDSVLAGSIARSIREA